MASTRSKTGNARPRVFAPVEASAPRQRAAGNGTASGGSRKSTTTTTKKVGPLKKTTTKSTSNASTSAGRVNKTGATTQRRKPHAGDKVKGAALKAQGKVTGKEGKKAAGTKKIRGTDGKKK